jgi:hypothetical protein
MIILGGNQMDREVIENIFDVNFITLRVGPKQEFPSMEAALDYVHKHPEHNYEIESIA